MRTATALTPTASRTAPSSQAIRLRNKPANSHGDSTRQSAKQHPATANRGTSIRDPDRLGTDSTTLEFTSWEPRGQQRKTQLRSLREAVVAFANARGGLIVLGVADRKRTRFDAIHGVGDLDAAGLRRDIYDGTEPHVLVEIDELQEPEGRLLAVRVPSGLPPHTTTDGVARIRIGKDSKPLTGSTLAQLLVTRGGRDVTADPVPGVRFADLDQAQVRRLRQTIVTGAERRNLAGLGDRELLEALGLTFGPVVTLAAVLLLGNRPTLARYAPQHELIFTRRQRAARYDVRRGLRGPLLEVLDEVQRLLDANLRVSTADISASSRWSFRTSPGGSPGKRF